MTEFYKCSICGKVIHQSVATTVPTICCGKEMVVLVANSVDASQEKHVPVVTKTGCGCGCNNGLLVTIGSIEHPTTIEHNIGFMYLETENGGQYRKLTSKPTAKFCCCEDKATAVYAYCNLHGLWKTEIK